MRGRALALLFAAACIDACGGEDPPAPIPLDTFGLAAQDAICDWAVGCRHMPDEPTCRRMLDGRAYDVRRARDTVAAGRARWDAQAAGDCLAGTRHALCAADPFGDLACRRLLVGLVPTGGACTTSFDCAADADCTPTACDAQCCAGTCGDPPPPPEPVILAAIGEPCTQHGDCVVGAYCELDNRCAPLPDQEGEHCLFGCAWGDLYCDPFSETCKRFGVLGQACGDGAPCDDAWSYCYGVCRDLPGPGQACDDTTRRCVPGSWCNAGICALVGSSGAPCTDDGQCDIACDEQAGSCVAYAACVTP